MGEHDILVKGVPEFSSANDQTFTFSPSDKVFKSMWKKTNEKGTSLPYIMWQDSDAHSADSVLWGSGANGSTSVWVLYCVAGDMHVYLLIPNPWPCPHMSGGKSPAQAEPEEHKEAAAAQDYRPVTFPCPQVHTAPAAVRPLFEPTQQQLFCSPATAAAAAANLSPLTPPHL